MVTKKFVKKLSLFLSVSSITLLVSKFFYGNPSVEDVE
jgi:hypothetical protein